MRKSGAHAHLPATDAYRYCIRGWTLVGKKDCCPVCNEKVSMRAVSSTTPWETQSLMWSQLLDSVRYLVVWNPVIIVVTQFTLYEFGV